MNNTFLESSLLRILNTLLLAGILATLVLILLHIRGPLLVRGRVAADIYEPLKVEIDSDSQPVEVKISR
jgi:hypothetical protein